MKKLFLAAMIGISLWSCNKKDEAVAGPKCALSQDPYLATTCESDSVRDFIAQVDPTAVKHSSGMYYKIVSAGFGIAPTLANSVKARYVGTIFGSTTPFDQSTTGIVFPLNGVIPGWQVGLPLIRKGGSIILYIPPSMAYRASGQGPIPPYAYLKFVVNLDDVL